MYNCFFFFSVHTTKSLIFLLQFFLYVIFSVNISSICISNVCVNIIAFPGRLKCDVSICFKLVLSLVKCVTVGFTTLQCFAMYTFLQRGEGLAQIVPPANLQSIGWVSFCWAVAKNCEHWTEYCAQCTEHSIQITVYNVQCEGCSERCIVYNVHWTS